MDFSHVWIGQGGSVKRLYRQVSLHRHLRPFGVYPLELCSVSQLQVILGVVETCEWMDLFNIRAADNIPKINFNRLF